MIWFLEKFVSYAQNRNRKQSVSTLSHTIVQRIRTRTKKNLNLVLNFLYNKLAGSGLGLSSTKVL